MVEPSLKDIEHVYHAALERKSGKERSEFLGTTCGRDSAVRSQVEALLEAHEKASDFLEAPIGEGTAVTLARLVEMRHALEGRSGKSGATPIDDVRICNKALNTKEIEKRG